MITNDVNYILWSLIKLQTTYFKKSLLNSIYKVKIYLPET